VYSKNFPGSHFGESVKYNKLTQEFLNQCHSEAIASESQMIMRYFAAAQYDQVLTNFSVMTLYITVEATV